MKKIVVVLCAFVLVSGFASMIVWAGSEQDPEVTDATLDAMPPLPTHDIVSAWIDGETAEAFNTNVKVSDLSIGAPFHALYEVYFTYNWKIFWTQVNTGQATNTEVSYNWGWCERDNATGEPKAWHYVGPISGSIDKEKGILTMTMPKENMRQIAGKYPDKGEILNETWAGTTAYESIDPIGWQSAQIDRAPDNGFGKSYIFICERSQQVQGSVSLICKDDTEEVRPGGSARFSLEIRNLQGKEDAFDLTASQLPDGWRAVFSPKTPTVAANQSKTVEVTIAVSSNATEGKQDIDIHVQSTSDLTITAKATLHVHVSSSAAPPADGEKGAEKFIPGFEIVFASIALGVVAFLVKLKERTNK